MKKIFSLVLFFISAGNCFGQQVTFQKTFSGAGNDRGKFVQQTADGGYIITGRIFGLGTVDFDVCLIRTNAYGDSLWTKTFGGTGHDEGYYVQETSDSGYIITGMTNSFGAGNYDVYLIKTNINGDTLWTKTYGGTNNEYGYSIQQTTDGGYVVTGETQSFGAGDHDVYLIKTDTNGNSIWIKTFGGTGADIGYSVKQTTDGGYIITGSSSSLPIGFNDVYLIKTDSNGSLLWSKVLDGTNDDVGRSIQQTTDSGYIIAGATGFGAGYDIYLIKTNTIGNLLWTKTFDGGNNDWGTAVYQTTDRGYIITGWTNTFGDDDMYLIRTDSIGDTLWTKTFGGTSYDGGYSIQQATDGGYIIAGLTYSSGLGNEDVYLIKTDSMGNSGCNQGSPATIITIPATQVTSPATIVTSPATIVTTPATIVGSGGTVTTLCTTVGISPTPALPGGEGVAIAPNPSSGKFVITFPNTINKGMIEIYSVFGKKIFTENIFNVSQKEIHLKNMEAGIYFMKVKDGEKEYCKKLMIE